ENKNAQEKISSMISLIDETVKSVRRISSELRPGILDDLGLIDALDWQSHEFEKRTGIRCRFISSPLHFKLDKKISTGIFRVYQETLTNVTRHSEATEVSTVLEQRKDMVTLRVSDNGKGFDKKEAGKKNTLGIVGMKE